MSQGNADPAILLPILKQIPLFSGLDENLHREVIQKIILMYYPTDYTIFKEGDEGDALYIVKKGTVQVFHPPQEEGDLPKAVAEINQGGFFGEMALVSQQPRNASVKTLTESEVFILRKEDFNTLMEANTTLAEQISATMITRIKENDKTA